MLQMLSSPLKTLQFQIIHKIIIITIITTVVPAEAILSPLRMHAKFLNLQQMTGSLLKKTKSWIRREMKYGLQAVTGSATM